MRFDCAVKPRTIRIGMALNSVWAVFAIRIASVGDLSRVGTRSLHFLGIRPEPRPRNRGDVENSMAKSQKRSSREPKKPKAAKAPKETMPAPGASFSEKLERAAPSKKGR